MAASLSAQRQIQPNSRILIVDDNQAIHDDFRKILGGEEESRSELDALHGELFGAVDREAGRSFELDSAYQGEEAIERVIAAREAGAPYALAFVDVRMPPGLDGVETTARLLEADPDLSVVICSAYSDHSWEEMANAIGKTDRVLILKKPFDTIEVRQLAHALQTRWELARLVSLNVGDLKSMVEAQTQELADANRRLEAEASAREEALRQLAESNEQIRVLAYQDGLTNLPNRRLLHEHLEKILARASRKGTQFAVLFVDLDNFKLINDSVGHHAADLLLRELADSLNNLVRSEDVIALYSDQDCDLDSTISTAPITDSVLSRLGGDEFVILLPEIRDRFSAGSVAQRVLKRLEKPFQVGDQEIFVTVSIGIATFPDDGQTTEILIRNADTAMYHAKQQGKSAYQYYSAAMNAASVERVTLESGLRRALADEQLELRYQPQVAVATGGIIGAEALIRWRHPERGYVPPQTFIPIAEEAGLIASLGEWVLLKACRAAREWQPESGEPIPVAINVSAVQFRRQDIYDLVRSALDESGLDPSLLTLEITESAVMSVRDRAIKPLRKLRELGVKLALDDFGTGYSSLSYLKSFPLSLIKIDRSFVAGILHDKTVANITEAIVSMAHILELDVLAEGVEQSAQLEMLREFGCDAVQGYYFSKAVPAPRLEQLLAAGSIAGETARRRLIVEP